jgi:hypothetical protein
MVRAAPVFVAAILLLGMSSCEGADYADQPKPEREPVTGTVQSALSGSCAPSYCGGQSPGGCACDIFCGFFGTCCSDFTNLCLFPPAGSCAGFCGAQSADFTCACDTGCKARGNCCADYGSQCTNDSCSNAQVITAAPFTATVSTTSATTATNDPKLSCSNTSFPQQDNNSVWFKFTPKRSGTAVIDALGSSYGTDIAVHTGSCGSFREVACSFSTTSSSDRSVQFQATANTTYYIEATDWYGDGGGGGSLKLRLDYFRPTFKAGPASAKFDAIAIDPKNDNIWYIGSTDGVYVTTNGGSTWTKGLAGTTTWGLSFDPARQGLVFVGSNNTLYATTNSGASFIPVQFFPSGLTVYSVLVNAREEIYVGHYWGTRPTEAPGLYKAPAIATAYTLKPFNIPALPGNQDKGLIIWDIEQDPNNGNLYVAAEPAAKPSGGIAYDPPTLRSKDGGNTWQDISGTRGATGSLPHHSTKIQVNRNGKVYFQIEGGAVYTSVNQGDTSQQQANNAAWDLILDPNRTGVMYSSDVSGGALQMSSDDAAHFRHIGPPDLGGGGLSHLAFNGAGTKLYAARSGDSKPVGVYVIEIGDTF